jgi:hypothetical protein
MVPEFATFPTLVHIRIGGFYVKNFAEFASHYGQCSYVSELFVEVGKLDLDSVREERLRSLRASVEARCVLGEG